MRTAGKQTATGKTKHDGILWIIAALALMASNAYAVPAVGQNGTDYTYGAYNWIVCRADNNTAWVAANDRGRYDGDAVCNELGYAEVDNWGGTCGTVCGYCGAQGYEYYDGNGLGGSTHNLRYTVHWRCAQYQGNAAPMFPAAGAAAGITALAAVGAYKLARKR